MAQKLSVDVGILELEINDNGVLRFNASDFNVYQRFLALVKELPEMEKEYEAAAQNGGGEADKEGREMEMAGEALDKVREVDRRVKSRLSDVFGPENDFDRLLGGVNVMAFGRNGERVISNLLNALQPYMEAGIKQHMNEAAAEAVAQAKQNRAKRRGKQ